MHILVVEDEIRVAAFLRQALEEEGHAVDEAHDGETGLNHALGGDFDLVVLDWLLPVRDGRHVCAAIRSAGLTVPILMLTARDAVEDRIAGLDSGADDYLTKPYALGEFLARVRALLRRQTPGVPSVLRVADLVLYPDTRHVVRGSRPIDLSAREFALLDYLMRNAGRTLSRTMIANHVWGFDFDGGSNIVDVYINYLRNKIDRASPCKLIRTVRRVGYCLCGQDCPANPPNGHDE